MRTQARIVFGLYDLTAKEDSNITVEDKKDFSILEELKDDIVEETKYATLENNYFNLDGTYKLLNPDTVGIGLCSNSMSDENGNFNNSPVLEINFTNEHSSNGITLQFSEENYCNDLNIKFYNDNTLLEDVNFNPDSSLYFCSIIVQKYTKVVITFKKTNIPYRYIKLINLIYGQNKVFKPEDIMSANLLEEIDLLSSEISINTFEFSVFSKDESFNIINPKGLYKLLQSRQMLRVFETNDNEEINMGTFYLDEWNNETESISNMKATDLIGVMDKTKFYGGMYDNVKVIDIIADIFSSAKIDSSYLEIEEDLKNIQLSGYIPICTHRQALQQVIFVLGAVADCSRSEHIKIYRPLIDISNTHNITYDRKKQDSEKVELNDIVTGVQVTAHKYVKGTDSSKDEFFNSELDIGEHLITFNEPVYDIEIIDNKAEIIDSNCNYVKIKVLSKADIVITGYKYIHTTQIFESKLDNLIDSDKENVLQITDATLIDMTIAQSISDRILNFYQETYKMNIEFKVEKEEIGDTAVVDTLYNQKLKGTINKLDIDLTGGFIANSSITGSLYEEEEK